MPGSFSIFNEAIRDRVLAAFPDPTTTILDVGAGAGKYRELLGAYHGMDACEVHLPYVEQFKLRERYRTVFAVDIMAFIKLWDVGLIKYDLIILGDVLEHLTVEDAQAMLDVMQRCCRAIVVAVPFEYRQGEEYGNPHEEHRQGDLTPELMTQRYPSLESALHHDEYGVYVWSNPGYPNVWTAAEDKLTVVRERLSRYKVCIATPTYDGTVCTSYLTSMLNTVRTMMSFGIEHDLLMTRGAPVERARNYLVAKFLAKPDYTHLLFVDADHGWHPSAVTRLLAMDLDVVGVAARKKSTNLTFCVRFKKANEATEQTNGAIEAHSMGTGFLLVRRQVFLKMEAAHPELKITDDDEGENFEHHFGAFTPAVVDGEQWGEDYAFCRRWVAMGGKVWCDPVSELDHWGICNYKGSVRGMVDALREDEDDGG